MSNTIQIQKWRKNPIHSWTCKEVYTEVISCCHSFFTRSSGFKNYCKKIQHQNQTLSWSDDSHNKSSTSNSFFSLQWNKFSIATNWITSVNSPIVLCFTSEESRHKHIKIGRGKGIKSHWHNWQRGRMVLFFSKHLILHCNNSVMSDTCHRTTSSMLGTLLWTVAFSWGELLKISSEITSLPQTKLSGGLGKWVLSRRKCCRKEGPEENTSPFQTDPLKHSVKAVLPTDDNTSRLLWQY